MITSTVARQVLVPADGVCLSGLIAEPPDPPRATLLALHGAGMTARYFQELLAVGSRLGMTVLALDRPGYRQSAASLPHGQSLAEQAATVAAAWHEHNRGHPVGAGVVVVGHSFGAQVALTLAARHAPDELLGVDISGCGHRWAVAPGDLPGPDAGGRRVVGWGPLRLYPPEVFATARDLLAPLPAREAQEVVRWPEEFRRLAPAVRAPVRITFAEFEAWWRHDPATLAELSGSFTGAPRVIVERQPEAGHNISLGRTARAHHLRILGFAEDLIAAAQA